MKLCPGLAHGTISSHHKVCLILKLLLVSIGDFVTDFDLHSAAAWRLVQLFHLVGVVYHALAGAGQGLEQRLVYGGPVSAVKTAYVSASY